MAKPRLHREDISLEFIDGIWGEEVPTELVGLDPGDFRGLVGSLEHPALASGHPALLNLVSIGIAEERLPAEAVEVAVGCEPVGEGVQLELPHLVCLGLR